MAKKFKFKLDPVLRLRENTTKTEKAALMEIMGMRYAKELEILKNEQYYHSLLDQKKGKINVADMQANYYHQNSVKSEIKKLNEEKEKLIEMEDIQRDRLNTAKREEKVLDKLKQRKKRIYLDEVDREEGKVLDEIGLRSKGLDELL